MSDDPKISDSKPAQRGIHAPGYQLLTVMARGAAGTMTNTLSAFGHQLEALEKKLRGNNIKGDERFARTALEIKTGLSNEQEALALDAAVDVMQAPATVGERAQATKDNQVHGVYLLPLEQLRYGPAVDAIRDRLAQAGVTNVSKTDMNTLMETAQSYVRSEGFRAPAALLGARG